MKQRNSAAFIQRCIDRYESSNSLPPELTPWYCDRDANDVLLDLSDARLYIAKLEAVKDAAESLLAKRPSERWRVVGLLKPIRRLREALEAVKNV